MGADAREELRCHMHDVVAEHGIEALLEALASVMRDLRASNQEELERRTA